MLWHSHPERIGRLPLLLSIPTSNNMTEIYKDFLPPDHFRVVRRLFMSEIISWHFNPRAVSTAKQFMFVHAFMNDGEVINPRAKVAESGWGKL